MKTIKNKVLSYPNFHKFKFRKDAIRKAIDLTLKHVKKLIDERLNEIEGALRTETNKTLKAILQAAKKELEELRLKELGEFRRTKIDKHLIENAEQQFTGFTIARNGTGNIEELIVSMGLKEYEWNYLKRNQMVNCLTKEQRKEVNNYFKE